MDNHTLYYSNKNCSYDNLSNMTFDTFPIIGMNPSLAQEVINVQNQTTLMKLFYIEQFGTLPLLNFNSQPYENIVDIMKKKCAPLIPIKPSDLIINKLSSTTLKSLRTPINRNIKKVNYSKVKPINKPNDSFLIVFGKYICKVCYKKYSTRENLHLHHLNIHLRIKPYSSVYCKKKFSHRNGKIYHDKKNHLHILKFMILFIN